MITFRVARSRHVTMVVLAVLAVPSRATSSLPQERPADSQPVFRASTELVQVDAVVTDKDGHYVTDLRAEDFEIVEDGKSRPISNFRYVVLQPSPSRAVAPLPAPAMAGETAAARRAPVDVAAMAIVVDDLSLSFESTSRTRRLLYGVVDDRLAAGELLAVLHTGGGLGNLQQFTMDKRLLHAAIDGMSFNLAGRGGVGALSPKADLISASRGDASPAAARGEPEAAARARELDAYVAAVVLQRQVRLALSTLTALERVVEGLARLPGRKSILLLSQGFVFADRDTNRVPDRLRQLTDAANRAAVVLYTLDPGGLQTGLPQAADSAQQPDDPYASQTRRRELRRGLDTLAEDTGGLALTDTNDLAGAVRRVVEDRQGYYLLGYEPDAARFLGRDQEPRFHRIKVAVKRRGLHVRSRRAFYARPEAADGEPRMASLGDALLSPFVAADLPLRLTPLWSLDAKRGPLVRCLLHMDARSMTFQEEADGVRKVELQALAVTFGATGSKGQQGGGTYTLRFQPEAVEAALRGGLALTLDLPATAGPYQVRAAVRDVASGRTGSAAQFVEVPDLKKGRPALSSIVMSGVEVGPASPVAAEAKAGAAPESTLDPDSTPALRRFRRGASIAYAFTVYNARVDAASQASLKVEMSFYRDGMHFQSLPDLAGARASSPDGGVSVGGTLRLGREMEPGAYTLAVTVEDQLGRGKDRYAIQWADFEVIPGH
jgi:VWFA-related protein